MFVDSLNYLHSMIICSDVKPARKSAPATPTELPNSGLPADSNSIANQPRMQPFATPEETGNFGQGRSYAGTGLLGQSPNQPGVSAPGGNYRQNAPVGYRERSPIRDRYRSLLLLILFLYLNEKIIG